MMQIKFLILLSITSIFNFTNFPQQFKERLEHRAGLEPASLEYKSSTSPTMLTVHYMSRWRDSNPRLNLAEPDYKSGGVDHCPTSACNVTNTFRVFLLRVPLRHHNGQS